MSRYTKTRRASTTTTRQYPENLPVRVARPPYQYAVEGGVVTPCGARVFEPAGAVNALIRHARGGRS